ncbi:MAG: YIP1 family protein [Acidobacteriota bacterium]
MNHTDALIDTQEGMPSKPFLSRLVGVFIEPGETFEDIARKPDFIAPLILLVLISMAVVETMLSKIGMEQVILRTLTQSGQAARMDPAQLSQTIHTGATIGTVMAQISGLLGVPILLLVVAGLGMVVLNGLFGAKSRFKEVFSATCYAYLPSIVGSVMAVAVMLFGDPSTFNPASPAPTNLGFFLNPLTTSHVTLAIATSLDFVILWFLILLAMGLSRVARNKVKSSSIFMIFAGVWLLLIIVKVGYALLV